MFGIKIELSFSKSRCISLITLAIFITGLVILSYYTYESKCIVESIENRGCYEARGHYMLEQYVMVNKNRRAFHLCGPVINCETSPCDININVGDEYYCHWYNEQLYNIQTSPRILYVIGITLIAALTILNIAYIFWITCTITRDRNNIDKNVELETAIIQQ
jgi:hypothetical protein